MEKERSEFWRKWHGRRLGDDGIAVSRSYRGYQTAWVNLLKEMCSRMGARLCWAVKGHYDETAMVERGGKYVYIHSVGNVFDRSTPNLKTTLIRTARHERDYTGGSNDFVAWAYLANAVDRLLGGDGAVEDIDLYPVDIMIQY